MFANFKICLDRNCKPPGAVVAFCDFGAVYKCRDLLTYLNGTVKFLHSEKNYYMAFQMYRSS